jgi:hypothetical protein
MKQIILFFVIVGLSGAASAAGTVEEIPPPKAVPSITPTDASMRKNMELDLKNPKGQKLATLKIQETKDGVVILFETKELSQKSFRLTLEPNCSASGKRNTAHKTANQAILRENEIKSDSFSDEFKLKGYSFENEGTETLKDKAVKLYQVDRKSKTTQLACGQITL